MNNDLEKKEIRSDKVRNIMIEKPPLVIRYGTTIITVLLLIFAAIAYYVIYGTLI